MDRRPDPQRFEGLAGYDFEPQYVDLAEDLDGLRMHFVAEGSGDPILLLHGQPTWAFLYRKMIGPLSAHGRVIAPDFIGFGRSDKITVESWYSYERHCDSLRQLVMHLDLRAITVVVQDWGGPIGLRIATEMPDRFDRIVMLNTGLFRPGGNWPGPAWLAFRDFTTSNPDLPIGLLIQGGTLSAVPDEVIAGYEAPFPDAASKAGARAFPLLMPVSDDSPGARAMGDVREELYRWDKPVLVAFSDSDPIFPLRSGERWAERIPGAEPFVAIRGASHFLQEDKGEVLAEAIIGFLSRAG